MGKTKRVHRACPQRGRRWSEEERAAAAQWASKHGLRAAAAKYGADEKSIHRWAAAQGIAVPGTTRRTVAATTSGTSAASGHARKGRRYGVAEKQAVLAEVAALGVTAVAKKCGVSRWTIYDWKRRQSRAQTPQQIAAALAPRSSAPLRNARQLSEERYHLIAETWLKNQALGPRQVRNRLRRTHSLRVGTSTVRRVLEEHGYVPPKIKVEHRVARRYEAVRPNQQWHFDFLLFYVHKARVHLLLIEDDYSRFIVGWALCEGERAQSVIESVEAAIARHGKPEVIVVDGGAAFFSWKGESQLEQLCGDYGTDFIKAQKLGGNAKIEALNANVRKELTSRVEFADLEDARQNVAAWVRSYNLERVHEGLGGLLVPADRYFGRADDVLAQIERGESVAAAPGLAARALDLFRVKSVGGQPELWLLGARIWPPAPATP